MCVCTQDGKVRVQAGLLSEQWRVALRDVSSYKILEFSTMKDTFKNFTSTGLWTLLTLHCTQRSTHSGRLSKQWMLAVSQAWARVVQRALHGRQHLCEVVCLISLLAGDWQKFFNRVKGIGSLWCCINAHPGHIHYDPWFDIPHQDKFNRQWDVPWEPKTGP